MQSIGGRACSLLEAEHAVYRRQSMQSIKAARMQSIGGIACSHSRQHMMQWWAVHAVYRRQCMQSTGGSACSQ